MAPATRAYCARDSRQTAIGDPCWAPLSRSLNRFLFFVRGDDWNAEFFQAAFPFEMLVDETPSPFHAVACQITDSPVGLHDSGHSVQDNVILFNFDNAVLQRSGEYGSLGMRVNQDGQGNPGRRFRLGGRRGWSGAAAVRLRA